METPETDLASALRLLALSLAESLDGGADHATVVLHLSSLPGCLLPVELVEDALLAAGQLLAGGDPLLPLLSEVWGAEQLWFVVERLVQELPTPA